jgi:TonB-dependent SusC/RagA subfamily outer membrane receptor
MNRHYFVTAICAVLMLFANTDLKAQGLLSGRKAGYYTYIYKITPQEGKKIYKRKTIKDATKLFHTLIDSIPTNSVFNRRYKPGHYIKCYVKKDDIKINYFQENNATIRILDNKTDLCIQVYDNSGNIIDNAKVIARGKRLRYNKDIKAYVDKKSNKRGVVKVIYNSNINYFELNRDRNSSLFRRLGNKIVFGTPIRYIYVPIRGVIYLPVDVVKSINYGYPYGLIHTISRFPDYIASIFDNYNNRISTKGYMVLNKPKYHIGDTLKLKSFITNKKGKPLNKEVYVYLESSYKIIKLCKIKPYRPGAYSYQFFLHDSLELKLDRSYTIKLTDRRRNWYMQQDFDYEEYELKSLNMDVSVNSKKLYRDDTLRIGIKVTDENDLTVNDGKIEINLITNNIDNFSANNVFVPDTLFSINKPLNKQGDTEIIVPSSVMPKANIEYRVEIRMRTTENEVINKTEQITYNYSDESVKITEEQDSLLFVYKQNGLRVNKYARIYATDMFGNKTAIKETFLPAKLKIDRFYESYYVESNGKRDILRVATCNHNLECYAERYNDSIKIVIANPRKIPFSYHIYDRNRIFTKGHGKTLNLKRETKSKNDFYIAINFLWGGETVTKDYTVPINTKRLKIIANQPSVVYPGQKTDIELTVTDYKGRPVKDVDLTAFSLTKKFNFHKPYISNFENRRRKEKNYINSFRTKDIRVFRDEFIYDEFDKYNKIYGLDSIEYYKFAFPKNSIYKFEHDAPENITQFAPFVRSNGRSKTVHVVYIDRRPVYFSWTTSKNPYSFKITEGYHEITLRTSDKLIVIDSVKINEGKKLILSIDQEYLAKNVITEKQKWRLSKEEKFRLYKYIAPYKNNYIEQVTYLEHPYGIHLLSYNNKITNSYNNFTGPVWGQTKFHFIDEYDIDFRHEPFFEYEFSPNLLKMRQIKPKLNYPERLYRYYPMQSITDSIITKEYIDKAITRYNINRRLNKIDYKNPRHTNPNKSRLILETTTDSTESYPEIINTMIFRNDYKDFMRVYPGKTKVFHNLDKGYYRVIYLYSNNRYHLIDSLNTKINGTNYHCRHLFKNYISDDFSNTVNKLIEDSVIFYNENDNRSTTEMRSIVREYNNNFKFTGDTKYITGRILSSEDGMGIPGANIVVKGTTIGVATDVDGYFSLNTLPIEADVLVVSAMGFEDEEINLNGANSIQVILHSASIGIDEVVVVAYGISGRSSFTGSVTSVMAKKLSGQVAGLSANNISGINNTVTIRGIETIASSQPLYIVDGKPYLGKVIDIDKSIIESMEVLKDESATAIYGSRAANGVIIITTKKGAKLPPEIIENKQQGTDEMLAQNFNDAKSIRNNFSDYAFWQPKLRTDKDGKVKFSVTFPDDITNWDTHYLAMNGNRQSGQVSSSIKAYKPMVAKLYTPRFMVEGDTVNAIGKVVNYTTDTIKLSTEFEINNKRVFSNKQKVKGTHIDTLTIVGKKDTVKAKYYLKTENNYKDGEIREVPVFRAGITKTEGAFFALDNDTTITPDFNPDLEKVTLHAELDILEVINKEIKHVVSYRYLCNEQLASKLKALIASENIAKATGKEFKYSKLIKKIIKQLYKRRRDDGFWGWWPNSNKSYWITLHVMEALDDARNMGYIVKKLDEDMVDKIIWDIEYTEGFNQKTNMLNILALIGYSTDMSKHIEYLDNYKNKSLNQQLKLTLLKQKMNIPYNLSSFIKYKHETLLGNIYYSDHNIDRYRLLDNSTINSLLMYRILRDKGGNDYELRKIRNYLFEQKRYGYWGNTYVSSKIINTILPDLLNNNMKISKTTIKISGDIDKTITEFPVTMSIKPDSKITISKSGVLPVYLTTYQQYFDKNPKPYNNGFTVTSKFSSDSDTIVAGKEYKLTVNVKVEKSAKYLMINIPIPAGCTYAGKPNYFINESHREYFKNETAIFCEELKEGNYKFELDLIAKYSGKFILNPAKAELVYFPTKYGNNKIKKITIK